MAPAAFQLIANFGVCGGARLNFPSMEMRGSLSFGRLHSKSKKPLILVMASSTASRAPLMVFVMFVFRSVNQVITLSMVFFIPSKTPVTKSIAIPMLSMAVSTASWMTGKAASNSGWRVARTKLSMASKAGFRTLFQTAWMALNAASTAFWIFGKIFSKAGLIVLSRMSLTASKAGERMFSQAHSIRLKAASTASLMMGKAILKAGMRLSFMSFMTPWKAGFKTDSQTDFITAKALPTAS